MIYYDRTDDLTFCRHSPSFIPIIINLKIFTRILPPKIERKVRIFNLGRKIIFLYKKKRSQNEKLGECSNRDLPRWHLFSCLNRD